MCTTSRRRSASVRHVITHARPVAGVRGPTTVRNSAKRIARHNVHRVVVSDRNHVNVVIYFVLVVAQVQPRRIAWPVAISTMMAFASKSVHPCKSTTPLITCGSQIQMANMHMVLPVFVTARNICSKIMVLV